MAPKGFKVVKGLTIKKTTLDSSHKDKPRAEARAKVLRNSLRGRGKRIMIWVLPLEEGDPQDYRKPASSWNNYPE